MEPLLQTAIYTSCRTTASSVPPSKDSLRTHTPADGCSGRHLDAHGLHLLGHRAGGLARGRHGDEPRRDGGALRVCQSAPGVDVDQGLQGGRTSVGAPALAVLQAGHVTAGGGGLAPRSGAPKAWARTGWMLTPMGQAASTSMCVSGALLLLGSVLKHGKHACTHCVDVKVRSAHTLIPQQTDQHTHTQQTATRLRFLCAIMHHRASEDPASAEWLQCKRRSTMDARAHQTRPPR